MIAEAADFRADLEWSHKCEEGDCWRQIYRQAFPRMVAMHNHREDGQHQRAGIDRSVVLDNGKCVWVDEKSRRIADTGDIMLEWLSNDRSGAPGWAVKPLLAHYIAYAFMPTGTAYLLPVEQMQGAWDRHGSAWREKYGDRRAINNGYSTVSTPVPISVLYSAIGQMLRASFEPL